MTSSTGAFGARRFAANLAVNLVLYVVNLAGGIILVPLVIHRAGLEAYSYFPLVMTFSQSITLVMATFTQTFTNFFSIAMRKNFDEAIKLFSTCNLMLIFIVILAIPFIIIIDLFIQKIITIPDNLLLDVKLLYILAVISALVLLVEAGISVITFSLNRLDLRNLSQIINRVIFLAGAAGLLWLAGGRLAFIGYSMLAGAVASLAASIFFWRILAPQATIKLAFFDKAVLKAVGHTSFWVLLYTVGSVFLEQLDLFFINIYWGSTVGGVYGAIAQAAAAVRTLCWAVTQVSLPRAAHLYAVSQAGELADYMASFQNSFAILMGVTVGVLISYSSEILTLWLGPGFAENTVPFTVVMAFLLPNVISMPSFQLLPILNKVQLPGIVTLALAGLYITALVTLGFVDAKQPIFVPVIGGTILMLKNAVFVPLYCAHLLGRPVRLFLLSQLLGILVAFSCYMFSRLVSLVIPPHSFAGLLANMSIVGALCSPYFLVAAQRHHRAKALKFVRKVLSGS
jgi:membrane protein EpsK